MKTAFDKLAGEYNIKSKKNKKHQEKVLKPFIDLLKGIHSYPHVLEIGCGVGIDSLILEENGIMVTAVDMSKEMLKYAKLNSPTSYFINQDFIKLKHFRLYDGVIISGFVCIIKKKDIKPFFDKIKENMYYSSIGLFCETISKKNESGYYVKQDYKQKVKRLKHRWTEKAIFKLLKKNGLKVIKSYYDDENKYKKKWINIIFCK